MAMTRLMSVAHVYLEFHLRSRENCKGISVASSRGVHSMSDGENDKMIYDGSKSMEA